MALSSATTSNESSSGFWICLTLAVTLRWIVSFYGYSGEGNPPMFGDYEAQRHWMEVTINLPVKEWYVNSSRNNLQYWGLDYPPLTAYHSLICGYFAYLVNPAYVQLEKSKGFESPQHKFFMRLTVLVSDLLTFLPAACLLSKLAGSQNLAIVLLIYPGLILIDHGHFQYNCVSLGLALFAFIAFTKNKDVTGSILFCLAINFKQMILYYSLPVFFYLLGKCFSRGLRKGLITFSLLSTSVIVTFLFLWWPFVGVAGHVISRIFPIERGLFEDKVSNFWCLVNIFIKIRTYFENSQLAFISTIFTLVSVLPSSLNVFIHPTPLKFSLSLINSSLGFFLFSYQVHEKSILLVSLPIMLLFFEKPMHCLWFLIVSSLSMLPLLIKDHLFIPFISLNIMYIIILWSLNSRLHRTERCTPIFIKFVKFSAIISLLLIILNVAVPPPLKYPHLYPLLVSVHCAVHFFYFLIYFNWLQLTKVKES